LKKETLNRTALLLFTHTAQEEAERKSLLPGAGKRQLKRVAEALIRHAQATASQSTLPLFTIYGPEQKGHTFGERLANAAEAVFEAGYEQLIILGNDCPALSPALLQQAAQQLANEPIVLGPATDGGLYLIGLRRASYRRSLFLALPWQSPELLAAWGEYAQTVNSSLLLLEPCADVDDTADFIHLLHHLPRLSPLRQRLLSIVASFLPVRTGHIFYFPSFFLHSRSGLRAPPVAA
jgi:glycosyltransferase A (GT-A) superfamily protein (DUF2064 family)